jgi:TIGR03009 family protein
MTMGVRAATAVLLSATGWILYAQDHPQRPPRDNPPGLDAALDNEIDSLLRKWHSRTNGITALYTEFTRTMVDRAFGSKQINQGSARFKHPSRARMNIRADKDKKGGELLLLTERPNARGKKVLQFYHYKADDRRLQIVEFIDADNVMRDPQEEGPLRLMFGIKPDSAHARYKFEILSQTDQEVKIRIEPKLEADRQEYLHATVVLGKNDFMPKRLTVQETRETVVSYEFDTIRTNIGEPTLFESILEKHFDPLEIDEKQWKVTREEKLLNGGKSGTKAAARDRQPSR